MFSISRNLQVSERKRRRRIAREYKRDDKRTETRGLTELERRGEGKEYKEDGDSAGS